MQQPGTTEGCSRRLEPHVARPVRGVSRDEETRLGFANVKLIPSQTPAIQNTRANGTSRPCGVRVFTHPLVRPEGSSRVRRKGEIYEKDDSGHASIFRVLGRNGGPSYRFDFANPQADSQSQQFKAQTR